MIDIYPVGIGHPQLLTRGILWWMVDIPGCNVFDGKTIFDYQQPLPLYGSGANRYAFTIFEQPPYDIDWSEEPFVPSE